MTNDETAVVEPLRTWVAQGEMPVILTVYRPRLTIRCGDGPEMTVEPEQLGELAEHFESVDYFFDTGDPDMLLP